MSHKRTNSGSDIVSLLLFTLVAIFVVLSMFVYTRDKGERDVNLGHNVCEVTICVSLRNTHNS